jgi:hypothetical protein
MRQLVKIAVVVIGVVFVLACNDAQEAEPQLADFLISVQISHDGDGLTLTCERGCAWTDLSWMGGISDGHVQYMDEYGMAAPPE